MGSFHTIDLEVDHPVKVEKDEWDIIAFQRLKTALDIQQKSEIAAVVLELGRIYLYPFFV